MCNININTICINSAKLKIICLIGKWELPSLKMEEVPMIKFMNFCNISVRWRSRYGVWPIAIPCFTVSTYHIPYVSSFLCIFTSLPRSVEDWSLISPTEPNHSFNLSSTTVSSRTCYCSSISFVLAIFSLKLLIQNFTLMEKKV